jgi:3-oxoacyl-[acyl-carrier-protein] synthase II
MKIYIRSSGCISAQNTFRNESFLAEPAVYFGTRLNAMEPDYKEFVDPKLLRRMSHIIKMGVATAAECLNSSNTKMPSAIITGTAYGCLEDTVTFITRIIEQNEEMLPPTSFIQSTHNTVAAQIALTLKCHHYNNTFVHKGISFESALMDAVMLLNEGETDNILVGGLDEITDTSFTILTRLGLYKRRPVSNLDLYDAASKGTIGGEGAAFFLLTDKASENNLAELTALRTIYKPVDQNDIEKKITGFLAENSLAVNDIGLVITGRSGDVRQDEVYDKLNTSLFKNNALANYKHLCGEYPTSTAFALWLASNIIKNKIVPSVILQRGSVATPPKRILIYNHYQKNYHSLMLVSAFDY